MMPSFLPQLLHRGFFPAIIVVPALALALLATLSTNCVAQSLKKSSTWDAIPSIGVALHSIDQSIQLFDYKSPSSTQQAQAQIGNVQTRAENEIRVGEDSLSLLIHFNERILFWTKKQNSPLTLMPSNATKPSSHHPQETKISINLTLTCDAPYMTRWVVESNGASGNGKFNMNYINRSYPRPYDGFQKPSTNSGGSSQPSPETSTVGGILNPNIEELIITSFDPNFQSGFVECVRVRDPQDGMEILKSRLYIFQRFGDGQSQSFRDSHNDTIEASPEPEPEPFVIPCKTHDPDAQPRLVLNGADISNDFEYDWKLGFTLKSLNETTTTTTTITSMVTHGDEYSCVLLSKDSDISSIENSRVFYKFVKANNRTEITEPRIVNQKFTHLTNSGRGEFAGGTITTQSPTPTPVSVPVSTASTSNTNEREDPGNKSSRKFERTTKRNVENDGNDYESVIDNSNSNGNGDTGTRNNEMTENNGNNTGDKTEVPPQGNYNNATINLNETTPESGVNSGINNNVTGTGSLDNANANQESKRSQGKIGTLVGSLSGVIVFVILILGCSVYFYCKNKSGEHALKAKNTNIHEMY